MKNKTCILYYMTIAIILAIPSSPVQSRDIITATPPDPLSTFELPG